MQQQSMSLQESISYTYYFIKEGMWRTLIHFTKGCYDRYGDPFFIFWRAFCIYKEGNPSQAVNELQQIESKKELLWATTRASIFYHRKCKNVDYKTVDSLELMETDFSRNASERAVVAAAYFSMFTDEPLLAKDMLEGTHFDSPITLVAKAWLEINLDEKNGFANAKNYFQDALDQDSSNLDALFGLARLGEMTKKHNIYQNAVNDILLSHGEYTPALIEKCRMNMNIQDYDQLKESIRELIRSDKNNIIAYQYWTFYDLAHEGNLDNGRDRLERLFSLINDLEPNNFNLMLMTSQLMSRVCGRATRILNICMRLLEKCRRLQPLAPEAIVELGNCYYMVNDLDKALQLFKEAASIDLESLDPMIGMLKAMIAKSNFQEAEVQLEFLSEMSRSLGGKTSQVAFIEGVLHGRIKIGRNNFGKMEEKLKASNKALDESLKLHIKLQKTLPQNLSFYIQLNPDYLLSLANEFLYHSDFTLSQIKDRILNPTTPTHLVKKAAKLLETTLKKVPGLIPAYMIAAKSKLIMGDMNAALMHLQKALEYDPKNEEAHILYAIIVYSNGNLESAYSSIKEALANNFDIDKNPFFMLIKGQIEFESNKIKEGLRTLKKAFELPGVQEESEANEIQQNRFMTVIEFNNNIRAQIFVYYSKALAQAKQNTLAKEIMEQAIMEFAGTEDEPVVLLGNADIAILSGDLKKAISILKNVEPNAKGYMEARKKLADIYLNNMMQRRQYAKCYTDLAESFPTFENLKLLGDALMKIQEPHDAIEAYERALALDPENQHMIALIGKAMSTTHDYQATNDYYERIVTTYPDNIDLKIDYAKILVKSNHLDKAEMLIDVDGVFDTVADEQNLKKIKDFIEILKVMGTISRKYIEMEQDENMQAEKLIQIWKEIINKQFEAIDRAKRDGGKPDEERLQYSKYCEELGNLYVDINNDLNNAKEQFQEAFKYNPNKISLLLEIAEVNYLIGDIDGAEVNCTKVLKTRPTDPWALRLLGECLMKKNELPKGIIGFKKVYGRDQTNFMALGQLFEFMRKAGQLDEVKKMLEYVEEKMGKDSNEPGLCYCRGLYYYFRRNPSAALIEFQKASRNTLYKNYAIRKMIDIYLNPSQDLFYFCEGSRVRPFNTEYIESIEVLLDELDYKHFYAEKAVYNTYCNSILRGNLLEAIGFLDTFIKEKPTFTPALLCVCVLRFHNKKVLDKVTLKSISKIKLDPRWGEESERAWLHVADFLMSIGKYDYAERELKKCLKFNKSSMKALEMMGTLHEKNDDLAGAAKFYNLAWDVSERKDCQIGYRIASLLFKTKRWVKSISIGKQVLAINPQYPKIKNEIVNEARKMLKA